MKPAMLDTETLIAVCRRHDVAFLGVFGSYARGEADAESDVDLLVRFSERKSLLDLVRIEREIETALGCPVDLLTEASISPYLRERILQEMVVLYDTAS